VVLQGDIAGKAQAVGGFEGRLESLGREVRGTDIANLSILDRRVKGAEGVGLRGVKVVVMGVVEVDSIGLQPAQ
jgi:hypothetical protein